MIKVADFEVMLARNDYAGIPKQSSNVYTAVYKGICLLLPKLFGGVPAGQAAEQPNSILFYRWVRTILVSMGDLVAMRRSIDNEQYGLTQCRVVAPRLFENSKRPRGSCFRHDVLTISVIFGSLDVENCSKPCCPVVIKLSLSNRNFAIL